MSEAGFPDRATIEAQQLVDLQALLSELIPANRFYTEKFATAGLTSAVSSLDEFLRTAPFTTKPELVDDQRAHPPYGTNLTYPLEQYTRFNQTSGTTGTPLRWLDTNESWGWMVDNWVEVYRSCGVGPKDRIYFAFSFGPFLGFWTAFDAGASLGCLCIPGGGLSSAARLRAILDNQITTLCCTPTYAIRLGEVAAQEGLDLREGAVTAIIVAGEPGGSLPSTRARIETLWPGARVHDHHGMTEVGPASYECPERTGVLHLMEPAFIPEVVNPETGAAVAPGEPGELVLTNLGRTASPLIRYRTGDLVRASEDTVCTCGRSTLALEEGILGRTDDMVLVRGVNLYPSAVEEVVRAVEGVAEYRVEIRTDRAMSELILRLEPARDWADPEGLRKEMEGRLRAAFNLRIPVTLEPAGSLPRFELKAQRWVRIPWEQGSA